jgi:hypothetical protein
MSHERPSVTDFVGCLAYLFVVSNGRPDGQAVRSAFRSLMGERSETPPPDNGHSPPMLAESTNDFEPLVLTNVTMARPELELEATAPFAVP